MYKWICSIVVSTLIILPLYGAYAENMPAADKGIVLNIADSEIIEIDEDILIASLRIEQEDNNAPQLQRTINTIMHQALVETKKYPNISTATQGYSVYKYSYPTDKKNTPKNPIWRGSQSLVLESNNSEELLTLVGRMQEIGFAMNTMYYTISNSKTEEVKGVLIERAIAKLTTKAKRIAHTLGKTDIQIININVAGDENQFPARNFMLGAVNTGNSTAANPVAMPGKSRISVIVSMTVAIN